MTVDNALLRLLVCPASGAPLILSSDKQELVCKVSRLAYPIHDGIPIMLIERARQLTAGEVEQY
jgi:uncharacterized protein